VNHIVFHSIGQNVSGLAGGVLSGTVVLLKADRGADTNGVHCGPGVIIVRPFKRFCMECGQAMEVSALFCGECGEPCPATLAQPQSITPSAYTTVSVLPLPATACPIDNAVHPPSFKLDEDQEVAVVEEQMRQLQV
jgi:hypothetical protein